MRKNGVLFTFMVLLLILNLLALNEVINEQQGRGKATANEITAMLIVNDKLRNIVSSAIEFDIENIEYNERVLPFNYLFDGNSIALEHPLPVNPGKARNYFDAINSYAVFILDKNYSNVYDGVEVDMNVAKNLEWGGSEKRLNFGIMPNCLSYTIEDMNETYLGPGSCQGEFDINKMARYDINITIGNAFSDDFNSVTCYFNGSWGCPSQDFNSTNPTPYFQLAIFDYNCALCAIGSSLKTVKGHYNPYLDSNITISCVPDINGACNSTPIVVEISEGIRISHNGNPVNLVVGATLKSAVESLYTQDINVIARNRLFNAASWREP